MNLFIESDEHPLLSELTARYTGLLKAVESAENSYRETLQTHSELRDASNIPLDSGKKKKRGKSRDEIVADRRNAYASAILKTKASFTPLVKQMDAMHDCLTTFFPRFQNLRQSHDDGLEYWMFEALSVNGRLCWQLYRRALEALGKVGDIKNGILSIEHGDSWWLAEQCKQAGREFATVPRNPEPEESSMFQPHVVITMLARAVSFASKKGFGGGCISVDERHGEDYAESRVERLLLSCGWQAGMQERTCADDGRAGFMIHPHPNFESDI